MRFFSLPTKILLLTLALMLVLIVLVTSLSLQRLGDSFTEQQTLKRQQVEQHFTQYQLLLQNQQQAWFESFAELTGLQQQSGFTVFTQALQQRYDVLSLYLNIEALWVFTEDSSQAAFASSIFPTELASMVTQTQQEQRPQSRIYCATHCSNVVSLPVSDQNGNIAVLVSSQTLADVVIALGQALQSEVAIVRLDAAAMTILSATGNLPALDQVELASWQNSNGAQFSLAEIPYFIYHIPLVQQQQQHFAILLLENISSYQAANNAFKWQLIALATLCFVLFAWLTNLLTRRLTSRLLLICHALPMLAENKYRAFRDALPKSAGAMSDEVDQLYDAGQTLSRKLEQLQDNINTQTRELENMAMYDRLTGLANRNMLQYQLKKSIAALTESSALLGLLFLDMDQFKRVNDIRGHEQGDQLLIEASNRLRASLDKTDIICRFGGDEFIVVTEVADIDALTALANRLIAAFRQPMSLGDEEYQLNISIGISSTRNAQLKPDDLVRQADLAMYQAKGKGGNSLHFYSQQMFDDFQNRLALESDLKLALAQQQFALHLQPKINLANRKLQGLEALLRWHSPARGMVSPDEFIAVLEYAHLMIPVGYWVIEQSFRIMVQLQAAGFTDTTMAINLSAAQLNDAKLPAFLDALLQQHQLSAALFELELTESMLANNINETIKSMQRLKSRGFRLAIDDFGTGYSSLSYLRQMPVDTIKIDKSFVFGMLDNQADFDIITSTIAMVRKLGLEVVAEGVETQAQCKTLTQHQCDIGQGYLFSRPIPSDTLIAQLQANLHDNGQWR
ncbi:EAL domain-containing protein [Rheinheimera sp. UJ51]|uniref:putative bifunctional diguanylate cyclase/phosphodiesterase n=1 Tax=Rheinheimera sp. UJ51 TaxID=2892446 RepID=UPI001E4EA756|nr:EAL domain-containing protein [Rheinheimera sp. UJ51]MCC5450818.1 EAL domain-containing protein [Rheinheimera sp. UJ51]